MNPLYYILSLKGVEGLDFQSAKRMLCTIIECEINRHYYLKTSEALTDEDRTQFVKMLQGNADNIVDSIRMLSQFLYKHYGKKVVILIDEYDVPLDKAFQNGYYKEMVSLIRGLFGQALKTNEFLQFAVLTGCLRVSKESIFTGLNNFAKKLASDKDARPGAFWINSSGNDMVKRFVDKADQTTRDEIENLVSGGVVEKQLRLDLTYDEIDHTIDNLWSVLFTTGYLTKVGEVKMPDSESYAYKLVIPNKEVREVFVLQIKEWFKSVVSNDNDNMKLLSNVVLKKDEKQIQRQLNIIMGRMISILDTKAPDDMKENFYHGLLLGLLRGSNPDWLIKSNRESGDGFSDIMIRPEDPDSGIVIEVKYSRDIKGLDVACETALTQIKDKRYDEELREEGRCDILAYGIAFCRKRCKVIGEKL